MNPISAHIATIREDYSLASLNESDILSDPILQFEKWFQEALTANVADVNAMTLCTVDAESKPHSRMVLLKGIEQNEFLFFTNYVSHKGKEIEINPHVSLVFHWKELQRQIRVEGVVQKINEEASTKYFHSRPRQSQLGAWASKQSETIASRQELENSFEEFQKKYNDIEIPKPPHWGGYTIKPILIEFWQGRSNRLHDRLCFYWQTHGSWEMKRLNP